ncbi:MAG: hypothetical protein MHM6MM_000714 [Cercozoa sp. M6MM]
MFKRWLGRVLVAAVTAAVGLQIYNLCKLAYDLYHPPLCQSTTERCMRPHGAFNESDWHLTLSVWPHARVSPFPPSAETALYSSSAFSPSQPAEEEVDLEVDTSKFKRGYSALYLHAHVHRDNDRAVYYSAFPWTRSMMRKEDRTHYLYGSSSEQQRGESVEPTETLHWFPAVTVMLSSEQHALDFDRLPHDMHYLLRQQRVSDGSYMPIAHVRQVDQISDDYIEAGERLPLKLTFRRTSLGNVRAWLQIEAQIDQSAKTFQFSQKQTDNMREMFVKSDLRLVSATVLVSILHVLFAFLALRNELAFWSSRQSLQGISATRVVWDLFSDVVVLLYLRDSEETSPLVTGLLLLNVLVAAWKCLTVFRLKGKRGGDKTMQYEERATRWLAMLLLPGVAVFAAYRFFFNTHKSLYSFGIATLAHAVYGVGFAMMTPQLFINYKLRSVAHMPWRVMVYRAFNTFVDDLFSLVVPMPNLHRLACLRDDIIFFIFLYQRYIYPVDKTRLASLDGDDEAVVEASDDSGEAVDRPDADSGHLKTD